MFFSIAIASSPAVAENSAGYRPRVATAQLNDLTETIRSVGGVARSALIELRPDDVSVEFGIELAIKSGKVVSVLTEIGAKASLRVTLGWKGETEPAAQMDDADDARLGDSS